MDGQAAMIPARMRALKIRWTLDYPIFVLTGLDGFGYCRVKFGLDMDLTLSEWILIGHLLFGFGLRSSSRFTANAGQN
jgi:hypothetical protein